MFVIGQFAQLAKVSVRTLRHYGDVGLLEPAHIDPSSGYRFYRADQLTALNRILVLKDLGFTLAEIISLTEDGISVDELAGMVRLRQAEAERRANDERHRLERMAARIQLLNGDHPMETSAIVIKPLDELHIATTSEPVDGFDIDFAPVFERLYGRLFGALGQAGVAPVGPHCALYEQRDDGRVDVIAAAPIAPDVDESALAGVVVKHLPPVARAATLIHTGDMSNCDQSYQLLQQWIDDAKETPVGLSREVYLDCEGSRDRWVTELQFALET